MRETRTAELRGTLRFRRRNVAAMMFSLPVLLGSIVRAFPSGLSVAGGDIATVDEALRDLIVYDADIFNGTGLALVPASGTTTAPDGAVIEVRAISVDDGGMTSTQWQTVIAASGAWSAQLSVPRNDVAWYRVEARVQGSAAASTQTVNRFGVGLVVMFSEQSNLTKLLQSGPADVREIIGANGNNFQYFKMGDASVADPGDGSNIIGPIFIRDGQNAYRNEYSDSLVAMAATFHKNAPGLKVSVLFDQKSGKGQWFTLDDDNPSRNWINIPAMIEKAIPGSKDVGAFALSHMYGGVAGNDPSLAKKWAKMFLGRTLDGTPLSQVNAKDQTLSKSIGIENINIDHIWSEAMPGMQTGRTKLVLLEQTNGYATQDPPPTPMENTRRQRLMFNAAFPAQSVVAHENVCPRRFDKPNEVDGLHLSRFHDNGAPLRARHMAVEMLRAAGILDLPHVIFDKVTWTPEYVELWSSVGPAGTHARLKFANFTNYAVDSKHPTFDASPGQWEVLGFTDHTGAPYRRTEIWPYDGSDREAYIVVHGHPPAAGRIRIYPRVGKFSGASKVYYSIGQAGLPGAWRLATMAGIYYHMPIVDVGLKGNFIENGLRVQPYHAHVLDDYEHINNFNDLPVANGGLPLNRH